MLYTLYIQIGDMINILEEMLATNKLKRVDYLHL